jgi:Ca2+-transporting ATPase
MPVHILFLQLVIDPACSVVFEAEPLDQETMRAKPRSQLEQLFDRRVLGNGLLQGLGLIALLLLLYLGGQASNFSESTLRSMLFTVLVLSSLALIYSNRAWRHQVWHGDRANNRYSHWMTALTLLFLGLIISVPAIAQLFKFEPLTLTQIALCLGMGACSMAWLEGLKWLRLR